MLSFSDESTFNSRAKVNIVIVDWRLMSYLLVPVSTVFINLCHREQTERKPFCSTNHLWFKGLFTPSESESLSENDQRTIKKDQRISDNHQRKCSLSLSLSLGVNGS